MAGRLTPGDPAEVTAPLARFVATARWSDVPDAVRHEAKRSLVNFFATALAGSRDPTIEIAAAVFEAYRANTQCSVIGRRDRSDALHAASLNAMSGNVFDFDDTHLPTILHPTAPVAPALLALAQTQRLSGQQLLLAFILGVEIECRLANAVSPGHYRRGWHITSTCGVFGAAAASARALGLDSAHIAWALGNASAQSSGLVETLGTMSKSVGVGNAARNGLLSAQLAARGFSGPRLPLEGAHGFLHVMGDAVDPAAITQGLGERWELLANTYKPYPCGVVLNPVIEACLALRREMPALSLQDIERVEITGHPLLRERTDRPGVTSGRLAQVSAQHSVAASLLRGKAGLDEFSDACVADPQCRAFADKIAFIDDPSYRVESASVTLHLRGAASRSHHVQAARGSLEVPLSDAELERKLEELCAWGGSGCEPRPLIDAIWSLDTQADAALLMQHAAGH